MTDLLSSRGIDQLRHTDFLALLPDGEHDYEYVVMCLAACLGFIPPRCDNWKDVVYCRDPITVFLHNVIQSMVSSGILKYNRQRDTYRAVNLASARHVAVPSSTDRGYELLDKKLLWEEDLHADMLYMEEASPRATFSTMLYWSQVYP